MPATEAATAELFADIDAVYFDAGVGFDATAYELQVNILSSFYFWFLQ